MKKLLSLVLSLFMVCALLPVGVFAEEDEKIRELKREYGDSLECWDNDYWVVRSQVPYLVSDGDCITMVWYTGTDTDVVLPEGIHALDEGNAWKYAEQIKSLTFPDSMVYIGYEVLCYLSNLEKVVIPDKVKSLNKWEFADCTALSEVRLPKNLKWIGEMAFMRCTSLKHIELPNGLLGIQDGAFEGSGLTELVIPASITELNNPVSGCRNMKKLVIPSPDTKLTHFNVYGKTYGTIYAPAGSKVEAAAKEAGIPFKPLTLNRTNLTLSADASYRLAFSSGSSASWRSSNSKVAMVDQNGRVTARDTGMAYITATLGGVNFICTITVDDSVYIVKSGDTLWGIASEELGSGCRYPEIIKLNGLKSTKIVSGQRLKLPER